ncbi:MAG: BrnT family toxin [Bacteroidetes bacterium]|jgi:uncharacterized DUF497 family protein|nr:BrnT family toxin [Bacteroidota bacterium]
MNFEFDINKSISNFEKHGIDFEQAQLLWNDFNLLSLDARSTDEPRTLHIGKIRENHWTAITTNRNNNIRIISVRRARQNEIELYES